MSVSQIDIRTRDKGSIITSKCQTIIKKVTGSMVRLMTREGRIMIRVTSSSKIQNSVISSRNSKEIEGLQNILKPIFSSRMRIESRMEISQPQGGEEDQGTSIEDQVTSPVRVKDGATIEQAIKVAPGRTLEIIPEITMLLTDMRAKE
jgi:hypothetical protein